MSRDLISSNGKFDSTKGATNLPLRKNVLNGAEGLKLEVWTLVDVADACFRKLDRIALVFSEFHLVS